MSAKTRCYGIPKTTKRIRRANSYQTLRSSATSVQTNALAEVDALRINADVKANGQQLIVVFQRPNHPSSMVFSPRDCVMFEKGCVISIVSMVLASTTLAFVVI
jgi:hypothetical protein